jgi:PilZ domain
MPPESPQPREPRSAPPPGVDISCHTIEGGPDLTVLPLDISASGMGLLLSQELPKGHEVLLVRREPGQSPEQRTATVQWCRRIYEGVYRVGVQLGPVCVPSPPASPEQNAIADPKLRALDAPALDGVPQASGAERRTCPRMRARGSAWATCRRGNRDRGPDIALGLVDVSEGGVRLLLHSRVAPGEVVSISLLSRAEPVPIQRTATVRWCVEAGHGSYGAGIEFDRRLKATEVQSLS